MNNYHLWGKKCGRCIKCDVSNASHNGAAGIPLILCVIFMIMAIPVVLIGESNDDKSQKIKNLEKELEQVRLETAEAQKAAQEQNTKYFQFQHDIVYSNKNAKAIYMEIKDLEKTLIDKRKALDEFTMKLPEMRQLMKDRNAAYNRVEELQKKDLLIQNEIRLLRAKKE